MPFFTYITSGQVGSANIPSSSHQIVTQNWSGNNNFYFGSSTFPTSLPPAIYYWYQTESFNRRKTISSGAETAYSEYTYTQRSYYWANPTNTTQIESGTIARSYSAATTYQNGFSGDGITAVSESAETITDGDISSSWKNGNLTSESLYYNTLAARVEASITRSTRGGSNTSNADTTTSYTSSSPVIQTSIIYFSKTVSTLIPVTARKTSSTQTNLTYTWDDGSTTYPQTSIYTTTYTTIAPSKDVTFDTNFIGCRGQNLFNFTAVAEWRQPEGSWETGQPFLFLYPNSFSSFLYLTDFPKKINSLGSDTFTFAYGFTMQTQNGQSSAKTSSVSMSANLQNSSLADLTYPSFISLGYFSFDSSFGSSTRFIYGKGAVFDETITETWGVITDTVTVPSGSSGGAYTKTFPTTIRSTSVHSLSTGNLTLTSYETSSWTISQKYITTAQATFIDNFYYGSSTDTAGTTSTFPAASKIAYSGSFYTNKSIGSNTPRITAFVQPLVAGNFCNAGATIGYNEFSCSGGDYSEMFTLSSYFQNGGGEFSPFSPVGFIPFSGATQRLGIAYTQAYSVSSISTTVSQTYATEATTSSKSFVVYLASPFTVGTVDLNNESIPIHEDCDSSWPYPQLSAENIYGTLGLDGTASYNLIDGLGYGLGTSLSSFYFSGQMSSPASLVETSAKIAVTYDIGTFGFGFETYKPISFEQTINPTPW